MRLGLVVVADPLGDDDLRFGVRLEPVLPNAFELERSHERFRNPVLLRRVRKDEFLMEPIRLREFSIELGSVNERVVGTKQNSGVRHRQRAKAINESIFKCPSRLDRIIALAYVETNAFAISAVENCVKVNQTVPARPNVRRIGSPAHVRDRDDADTRFDARRTAFLKPTMTLPAFDLHDSLHGFAIHSELLHAKTRPNHSISKIRLGIDHVLDPLRKNLIHDNGSLATLVVRCAPRNVQESTDSLTRSFAFGDHTLDV